MLRGRLFLKFYNYIYNIYNIYLYLSSIGISRSTESHHFITATAMLASQQNTLQFTMMSVSLNGFVSSPFSWIRTESRDIADVVKPVQRFILCALSK